MRYALRTQPMCVSARVVSTCLELHSTQLHQRIMAEHRQDMQCIAGIIARLHVHLQVSSMRGSLEASTSAQLAPLWLGVCQPMVVTQFRCFLCDHAHHEPCHLCQMCGQHACTSSGTSATVPAHCVAEICVSEHCVDKGWVDPFSTPKLQRHNFGLPCVGGLIEPMADSCACHEYGAAARMPPACVVDEI